MWVKYGIVLGLLGMWSGALAQAQIRAHAMLGDSAETIPLPIRIDIRHGANPTEGRLVLRHGNQYEEVYPITLPANARKTLFLSLPDEPYRCTLWWEPQHRAPTPIDIPLPIESHMPVVFIGDIQGGFSALHSISYLHETRKQGESERQWRAVYWKPEQTPDSWRPLAGIPVIVLVDGAERLSAEQMHALIAWMLMGGHLIVSVGGTLANTLSATPLAPLLPSFEERTTVFISTSEGQMPLVWWRVQPLPRATTVRSVGANPISLSRPMLQGRLTLFLGDLTAPAWRQWQDFVRIWEAWLADSRPPARQMATENTISSQRAVHSFPVARIKVAVGIMGVASFGVVLIWWNLRARGQLARAVPWLLGLGLASTGAMLAIFPSQANRSDIRLTQTLLVEPNLPIAARIVVLDLYLSRGEYQLSAPAEAPFETESKFGLRLSQQFTDRCLLTLSARGYVRTRVRSVETIPNPIRAFWQGDQLILETQIGRFVSAPLTANFTPLDASAGSEIPRRRLVVSRQELGHERLLYIWMNGVPSNIRVHADKEAILACIAVP